VLEPVCVDSLRRCASLRRTQGPLAGLAAALVLGGCVRDPVPCDLDVEEGELVVTEIRGPQDPDDTRGQWFELWNATDRRLDLAGLRGTIRPLDGSPVDGELDLVFIVREPVPVEPGAYVVLGTLPLDAARRPEVDYSVSGDFRREPPVVEQLSGGVVELPPDENADPRDLFANARLQLYACDRLVDEVIYAELPSMGTRSLDGRLVPSADDNDDPANWCADATPAPTEGPQTATGLPGSGGEANRPCT
jgi:hypothetical protein